MPSSIACATAHASDFNTQNREPTKPVYLCAPSARVRVAARVAAATPPRPGGHVHGAAADSSLLNIRVVAAAAAPNRLHGTSASQPRRRRDSSPRSFHVATLPGGREDAGAGTSGGSARTSGPARPTAPRGRPRRARTTRLLSRGQHCRRAPLRQRARARRVRRRARPRTYGRATRLRGRSASRPRRRRDPSPTEDPRRGRGVTAIHQRKIRVAAAASLRFIRGRSASRPRRRCDSSEEDPRGDRYPKTASA